VTLEEKLIMILCFDW